MPSDLEIESRKMELEALMATPMGICHAIEEGLAESYYVCLRTNDGYILEAYNNVEKIEEHVSRSIRSEETLRDSTHTEKLN